jgi:hypothetical protein
MAKTSRSKPEYKEYSPKLTSTEVKEGDVLLFAKIRNWERNDFFSNVFGKVVKTGRTKDDHPYIVVSFDEELNPETARKYPDLMGSKREFILSE